ncbi:hypothetical protein EKO24_013520 [Candidatus Methylobacter oryzae]|uniref:Uncharacterized protein n=1 Tax=Candidatus Methylobacter oryzae TaxID=2497749 RepID=A0ABY3C8Y6_9GAMM|nr:hypothetical protein EKO24_013520 [Candidatus Methylobacter oryzae]
MSGVSATFKRAGLLVKLVAQSQTFQVLRLPWMAEVLELPGAAPVKTWKVYGMAWSRIGTMG